ncbi:MAG: hypothetical protein ACRENO_05115 [Thermodesulfobacteriota bacterium]
MVRQKLESIGMIKIEAEKGTAGRSPEEPAKYKWLAHMYFNN